MNEWFVFQETAPTMIVTKFHIGAITYFFDWLFDSNLIVNSHHRYQTCIRTYCFLQLLKKHNAKNAIKLTIQGLKNKMYTRKIQMEIHQIHTWRSIKPLLFTGRQDTLNPSASRTRQESSTHLCSVCVVMMCFFLALQKRATP